MKKLKCVVKKLKDAPAKKNRPGNNMFYKNGDSRKLSVRSPPCKFTFT